MKKVVFASLCLTLILVTVLSCSKMQGKKSESTSTESVIKALASSGKKISEATKTKIQGIFGKLKLRNVKTNQKIKTNGTSANFIDDTQSLTFDNGLLAIYENSAVQAVIFEQPNSLPGNTFSFVTFQQNGLVGDMAMFVQVEQLSSTQYRSSFYDLDYSLIGQFMADEGVPSNFQGFDPPPPTTSTNGWWGRWAGCLSKGFNTFTDGNPWHAAAGLTCWAFGPACATGAALGCAAAATFQ